MLARVSPTFPARFRALLCMLLAVVLAWPTTVLAGPAEDDVAEAQRLYEEGRARVPLITESTHPAFSFAVVKALEDWRFAAPTHRGRCNMVGRRPQSRAGPTLPITSEDARLEG